MRRYRLSLDPYVGHRRLAALAKMDPRDVADIEKGKKGIGLERARRLARALGVGVSVLLYAAEDEVSEGEEAES